MRSSLKKFELTNYSITHGEKTLFRIRALINFFNVCAGDLGGFVEEESNLSQNGNCWIYNNAKVFDGAKVTENATVFDNAIVCNYASISGMAIVEDNASILCPIKICENATISQNALITDISDFILMRGFGSYNRNTTFFNCEDGQIGVSCGCFSANLEDFENKVKETHGNNKYAKEYLKMIELVKIHFDIV